MMSAEEGTPPAEAELRAMKVSALKKRAKEAGVDEAELEEADDADDVKGTLITLIVERERVPEPAEQLVMMEAPDSSGQSWQAGSWLGVITAGSLW